MARQAASPVPGSFADRLCRAQEAAGLTNDQLAFRAKLSLRLLQKYRAGQVEPRDPNLRRLERVLGSLEASGLEAPEFSNGAAA